ncbi:glycosyltransferase, partial [Nocardioides antri]
EPYGMAPTEALARGIPVLVSDVGGHGEAVGRTADGSRPGVLVPPDDPEQLAVELRRWLRNHTTRERLRRAAAARRATLVDWTTTARRVATALQEALSTPGPSSVSSTATPRRR